jgi:hypothetical protein
MIVDQVTQIPCGCSNTTGAPDGCLQYYSGISGNIKSFNYDNVGSYKFKIRLFILQLEEADE